MCKRSEKSIRRREARPERISLGNQDAVRNDIVAKGEGSSERTLNRKDKDGAPFLYFGGCKYRPERDYQEFMTSRILRMQPAKKRAAS